MTNSHPHRYSPVVRSVYWVSALLVIALGVYLTHIRLMNSEWLTRAGCLVVMLGIWSGIGGVLQERLFVRRTKWRRRNALAAAKARLDEQSSDPEQVEKLLAEVNDTFDQQIAEAAQNLRLSIGVLEVSLLMTGTFLWGFGDLIMS